MEPLRTADPASIESEKEAGRKIQFSVPSPVPVQLDPRQVELIRRRRPTPATLFKMTDAPSPEEESSPHQWLLGENGALKSKLNMSTYKPPSLKAVQMMAQAHLSSLSIKAADSGEPSSGEEEEQQDEESPRKESAASLRVESNVLGEPCDLLDTSTARANLGHHLDDQDNSRELEVENGE